MIIEDLLTVSPGHVGYVKQLVENENLTFGPYYCQPDWQLSGGELLIRNLLYGRKDAEIFGRPTQTGWLVDTFGHISQSPQIHQMFGIDAVYVWRGVPELTPYFKWQAADGSDISAINLFGGYRNLYGLTLAPEVAERRVTAEISKLQPFYPTADLPLFDGYDLEDDPEDPITFLQQNGGLEADISLQEATPESFAKTVQEMDLELRTVAGELNSGKFGATFPGTFSARTYLKIMARDCEHMLYQVCEPLAVLAYLRGRPFDDVRYEQWSRLLLQNAVHDCLCGVSIDQVHEKMEVIYRQVFDAIHDDVSQSLAAIMADFAPGAYAISTSPFPVDNWQFDGQTLHHIQTDGIGVWPIEESVLVESISEPAASFTWKNDHYEARINEAGQVLMGSEMLGQIVVSADHGDTYSVEKGQQLGVFRPLSPPTIEQQNEHQAIIFFQAGWEGKKANVTATIRLIFDDSPLVRWQIDLDSQGTDILVEMTFATDETRSVHAGMPFDMVQRPLKDVDLLPEDLPEDLAKVLLGQREINEVVQFPFHHFVSSSDGMITTAVFAKGLRAYSIDEDGTISLPLRRSVEWLTRSGLKNRVGDAGPFFYVPDARCERLVRHELAVAVGKFAPDSAEILSLNAQFQNPPLLVQKHAPGTVNSWPFFKENLPLSSLSIQNDSILARISNPTNSLYTLSASYVETDVWGQDFKPIETVLPKKIVTLKLTPEKMTGGTAGDLDVLTPFTWRVGPNHDQPDPEIIMELGRKIDDLDQALLATEVELSQTDGEDRLRWEHQAAILGRERLEYLLSKTLNERKLVGYPTRYLFEYDEEIAKLGAALNRMRIKRRVFDYVREVL